MHLFFSASLLLLICSLCACKHNQDDTAILQQIDEGLAQSNQSIRHSSDDVLHSIEQKTYDHRIAERAKAFYPKAIALQKETDNIFKNIESLRSSLNQKDASGITLKNIEELYAKLTDYCHRILSLDDRLSEDLSGKIFIVSEKADSSDNVLIALKEFLLNQQDQGAKVYLRRIENNIAIDEQKAMIFLHYQATPVIRDFDAWEAIVGQNAKVLETGGTLEITTGLGNFKTYPFTHITVSGHPIPLNEKGLAVYQLKTSTTPGNYSIPVKISFTDQDGAEQTRTIPVEYKTVSTHLK